MWVRPVVHTNQFILYSLGPPTMKDLIPKVRGRIKESVFITGCPGVGDVAGPDSTF